jgi:hypothetical protein
LTLFRIASTPSALAFLGVSGYEEVVLDGLLMLGWKAGVASGQRGGVHRGQWYGRDAELRADHPVQQILPMHVIPLIGVHICVFHPGRLTTCQIRLATHHTDPRIHLSWVDRVRGLDLQVDCVRTRELSRQLAAGIVVRRV